MLSSSPPEEDGSEVLELAREIFGSLAGKKVLIVGAGKMSELAARHLHRSGADQVFPSTLAHIKP